MKNSLIRNLSPLVLSLVCAAGLLTLAPAAYAQDNKDATAKTDDAKKDEGKKDDGKKKDPDLAASVNPDDPAAVKVYIIEVRGDFGKDFSNNLMNELLADAKKVQPDIILFRIDAAFLNRKGNGPGDINDLNDTSTVQQGMYAVEGIGHSLMDDIDADPEWKLKPRRIAWVKKALGPTALLPFFCKEIYFTPDGIEGGIGYLDHFFGNMQSIRVREKLRGAILGHIESLAIKGGHDYRIVRAMTRMDYELSYTLKGGKPEFFENRTDGEVLLTDDGVDDRADSPEDYVMLRGNDVLNLRADTARTIGWSEGNAENLSDLMFELGHARAYRVIGERPRKIIAEFQSRIRRMSEQYGKLTTSVDRDFPRRETGDTPDDRNRNRAKLKRDLEEMNGLLKRYPEIAFRHGDPEQMQSENNKRIDVLEQEIRLDRNTTKRKP